MEDGSSSGQTSSLPSYTSSVRTATARQAYKRVQRVIALQWRGIAVVLLIIADVVFFSVVFVYMDSASQAAMKDPSKAQPWLACLFWSGGDKNKCLDEAESLVLNEPTVMAVLILLSMNGIWCLFFLGRWSMVRGWIELVQKRVFRKREFVSVDARRFSNTPRAYEMLKSPSQTPAQTIQSPTVMESPSEPPPMASSPLKGSGTKDYFGQEARYTSPHLSFSTPRPPSASAGREWDPAATHAKSSVMPGFDSTNKI
ncbi:MAG: hypothetical protein M1833_000280 [Piccolia ochrophora]|nr:MAG: hypothetical protein M1833_000280 [Piccolia ochrophora]